MKRKLLIAVMLLSAFCCAALAHAESGDWWVEIEDEITIELNGYARAFYGCPQGGAVSVSCSDPRAFQNLGTGYGAKGPFLYFRMLSLGEYTLQFTGDEGVIKEAAVTVVQPATAIHFEQDPLVVEVGQTVPVRYTLEGGALRDPFRQYDFSAMSFDLSGEAPSVTGLKQGRYPVTLANNLGTLTVIVVDPCEGVRLRTEYDRGSVGYALPVSAENRQGEQVFARIELTEGADCADLEHYGQYTSLRGKKAGWVTLKAYGTDGSTDEARLKICEPPTELRVSLSSQTVAAGESLTVNVEYLPEGSWYPLGLGFYPSTHSPEASGLEGPVAVIDGSKVTGVLPGTCDLHIYAAGLNERRTVTVTDSAKALVFHYPQPYFDWRYPFQLSVSDGTGNAVPAVFSAGGDLIHVTEDGLLTAERNNAATKVTVETGNGLTYKFTVETSEFPTWLEPEYEALSIPLDMISYPMCEITADAAVTSTDLALCSNDESVVKVDNWHIYPQAEGVTTLTVWSRYSDARCTVLVRVTPPYGRLYVDGTPDQTSLSIAMDTTLDLPTVTDYNGNPVPVSWSITHQSVDEYNPYGKVVSLENGKRIKCWWADGAADLKATAASGETYKLTVFPYRRATSCSFRETEYTVYTGENAYINFEYGKYGEPDTLDPRDVTFTLTGDTDCVRYEPHFSYHMFTGLREGTVTLTARLYNGVTATSVIRVATPEACKNGHDPKWVVTQPASARWNGVRQLQCSRCGVFLGEEEAVPCWGVLSFSKAELDLTDEGETQAELLHAALNGDPRYSFTFRSSNPEVAALLGDAVVGLKPGAATITVTMDDCAPAVCRVRVRPYQTLTLPVSLTEIEDGAFQGVTAARVALPDRVTAIGAYAFADCPNLKEMTIPASVTSIGENAFANDPLLTLTVYPGSRAEQYCAANNLKYRHPGE